MGIRWKRSGRHTPAVSSGLKSAWTLLTSATDALPSAIGGKTNIGTANSGSVNPGSGVGALVTVSFKATSTTAGVTLNLNGTSRTVGFTDQRIVDWTEWFAGNGPYTFAKTGGRSYTDLSAVVFK